MQIQINSDHQINPSPELASRIRTLIRDTLDRHSDRITRVEVHLNDQNSLKGGANDKRCTMEARVRGHQPVAVTSHAPTLREAMGSAADKLQRSLEHLLGRLERR